jgi:putative acetyltransferase
MISLKYVKASDEDVRILITLLDKLMYKLYNKYLLEEGDSLDEYLDDYTVLDKDNVTMLGAFNGNRIVGMGAVKDMGEYAELKRIFVLEDYRGWGVGARIVSALEKIAREQGHSSIKLETGTEQQDAINLFKKLGFEECEHFGCYGHHPASVYMDKKLI